MHLFYCYLLMTTALTVSANWLPGHTCIFSPELLHLCLQVHQHSHLSLHLICLVPQRDQLLGLGWR